MLGIISNLEMKVYGRIYMGYRQVLFFFLHKRFEYLKISVSEGNPGTNPPSSIS
jgi:hypothetical protein